MLQLLHSGYRKVSIEVDPQVSDISNPDVNFELGSDIRNHKEEENKFLIILYIKTVSVEGNIAPINLDLECFGEFQVNKVERNENESEDDYHKRIATLVKINGSAMLYSAAREYVSLIASRVIGLGYAPPLLPTIDPRKVFKSQHSNRHSSNTLT